jgi:type IV secretion system protein VirB3
MAASFEQLDAVPGFTIPVHRALTDHIMLGSRLRAWQNRLKSSLPYWLP